MKVNSLSLLLTFILFLKIEALGQYLEISTPVYAVSPPLTTQKGLLVNDTSWIPESSHGFFSGAVSAFLVTVVSEIGDKTFFIAIVLSLSHSAIHVFGGASSALALMTLLSVGLGLVFSTIPAIWIHCVSTILFLLFGLTMLREGYKMNNSSAKEEFEEVQKEVDNKVASKHKIQDIEAGISRFSQRWVFIEAFVMTFLAEWGDRSQVTTVVLAVKHNMIGVLVGAVLAHGACTLLAVTGGRVVSDRISIKTVTIFGGFLFLAFALNSLINGLEEISVTSSPSSDQTVSSR